MCPRGVQAGSPPKAIPCGFYLFIYLQVAAAAAAVQGRGSGVNFALPVDMLMDIVPKLIVYGNASGKRV